MERKEEGKDVMKDTRPEAKAAREKGRNQGEDVIKGKTFEGKVEML